MKIPTMTTSDLTELTQKLGQVYRTWKDSEKEKNELKEEFFTKATQSFDWRELATKIVHVGKADNKDVAREVALKENPFWKVNQIHFENEEYWVLMEEDISLKPFAFVNPADGMVYQRTVVEGDVMLDDARLQASDPELWKAITRRRTVEEIIPFDELEPDVLERLSDYLFQTRPSVKFLAPRPAREDELERE